MWAVSEPLGDLWNPDRWAPLEASLGMCIRRVMLTLLARGRCSLGVPPPGTTVGGSVEANPKSKS